MDGMMHGGSGTMDMNGSTGTMMPPPPPPPNSSPPFHRKKMMMMMHMTFYWGDQAVVLFNGWPGSQPGMYIVAIIFVFALAFIVEGLSHSSFLNHSNSSKRFGVGLAQTALYCVRSGLGYMVMLSVMSFNAGVFLAAVAGHTLGFFFFGSSFFFKGHVSNPPGKTTDLPPMNC